MRIGLFVGALALMRDVAERLHRISDAERDGFDSYWLPQHFGADMLTVIAMAGMQTHRIELGTAVVPTYPRHPVALAQQALTAQVAVGGRLTLGIGVSHRSTIEDWAFPTPIRPITSRNISPSCAPCCRRSLWTFRDGGSESRPSCRNRMPTCELPGGNGGARATDAGDRGPPDRRRRHLDDRPQHPPGTTWFLACRSRRPETTR